MHSDSLVVDPASQEERLIVEAMMKRYLVDLGGSGQYPHLETYWIEPQRSPYLLRVGGQAVGFALVEQVDQRVSELVEFYVEAESRRRGIGRQAAEKLFGIHPGTWRVGVRSDNARGQHFWRAMLRERPAEAVTEISVPQGTIYEFVAATGEA